MMYVERSEVTTFFEKLENANIQYAVLRDVENCIPDKIDESKDIDLIINSNNQIQFQHFMRNNGFKKEVHPWDFGDNFIFLYAMDKFEFYVKGGLILDICYQLPCRSTDNGEWIPIDQKIQESVWKNRIKNAEYGYFQLSTEDEFVHLITRCIFDKRKFNMDYQKRLDYLYKRMDIKDVREKLSLVVFKYTEKLLEQIQEKCYDNIYDNYIKFTDY